MSTAVPPGIVIERIVVVGNGIAGQTACDSLRGAGFTGQLTVVGDEPVPAYSRPALSKALLTDGGSHELAAPAHGATERLGVAAVGLDVDARLVHLDDGTALTFDGLVIATGARPRPLGEALVLRTLDDALALRERLADRPSVAVVGAGPLGMEVASAAAQAGCEVTVVADTAPMRPQFGPYLSELFTTAATAAGVKLVHGTATGFAAGTITLDDGSRVTAELVVAAIGDIPNVEWLRESGVLTDGRLVADSRGRVAPGIVAAGDVAHVPIRGMVRRIPLWNSAIEQARIAATAVLLGDAAPEFDADPYFWTEQFGLHLKAIGHLPVDGEPTVLTGEGPRDAALLHWRHPDGAGVAVAINHRIPIPRLRRAAATGELPSTARAAR
ncbi:MULTISPECIES: NAD(P)/FAD-dependent oxidoreductase [Rhodococcus]|uniref:FAD-dependent oxidoreductase n=1 Tax=Rhodococcus rhodochrous TaxID=1829 RepID=A0AA47A9I2_RHORH|nr:MULTISPECIES: FAD-dependent oxidoreductase [Rhodococcus]AYA26578.1 NAD(P)/FAD-dependent oxidoreductase [Rhodococcus rhodochrous]MDC3726775.1 FAD-dependent oxidoreductase [Rhodococcus sp. Rp3]TWH52510.1 NAD(P)H-nitrite reductase [Rhodococcus rhodochrous J38]UZF43043.1 FAD-dependent oxidoreductase [Rhodococcus rhodochrous]